MPNMLARVRTFFEESRQEFRHVNWPTRAEAIRLTSIVIGISLGLAVFLGFFDHLFSLFIQYLVERQR